MRRLEESSLAKEAEGLKEKQKLQLADGSWIETDLGDSIRESSLRSTPQIVAMVTRKLNDVAKAYRYPVREIPEVAKLIIDTVIEEDENDFEYLENMTTAEFEGDITDIFANIEEEGALARFLKINM